MGLFGTTSPFDSDVEKATSENNTSEHWGLILDICDKASKTPENSKNYLRSIIRRLNNPDPHIALQAATLLDACVSNCGKTFHVEVASREFENEFCKLMKKSHHQVQQKLKESLKKWAEGEFKSDSQLNLIPSLYVKLKNTGIDFSVETPVKKTMTLSKDPNVVQTQDEEDQIAKAIELSLKETSGSPRTSLGTTSLYPTNLATNLAMGFGTQSAPAATPPKEPRKVRALYDFEAAEDNELTFSAGEIIVVIDDSDANWWKGSNQRGEGLFPSNFVSADLSAEPEQFLYDKSKKVQFKESSELQDDKDPEDIEINEEKINRLVHLMHEADPTTPLQDSDEMLKLEREVNGMGPLIDAELERVDRKHAQLTKLSTDLVDALSLYHMLMREPQYPSVNKVSYTYPPGVVHPTVIYNGGVPPPQTSGGPQYLPPYGVPQGVPSHDRPYIPPQMPQGGHPIHVTSSAMPPPGLLPPPQLITQNVPSSAGFPPPQTSQVPPQGYPNIPMGYTAGLPPQVTQIPHTNVNQGPQSGNYPNSSNSQIM